VAIAVDGADEFRVVCKVVAVANGRWFGGGMRIAPDAFLDDGVLDLVVVGDVSAATLVRRLPLVYRGDHLRLPEVRALRGRVVTARPVGAVAVPLDLDGESPGCLPATFSVVPGALRVRA
jgi:diacylglycerol kinase family enzyme